MIQIFYDRSAHRVSVSGHAGTAPAGEDLVCAAVTALTLTLAQNIEDLEGRGAAKGSSVEMESGCADLVCPPVAGYGALVDTIFDAICTGYSALADAHPGNVRFYDK